MLREDLNVRCHCSKHGNSRGQKDSHEEDLLGVWYVSLPMLLGQRGQRGAMADVGGGGCLLPFEDISRTLGFL